MLEPLIYLGLILIYIFSARIVAEKTAADIAVIAEKMKEREQNITEAALQIVRRKYYSGLITAFIPLLNTFIAAEILLEKFES